MRPRRKQPGQRAEFRGKWPKRQVVADVWARQWERVIRFFQFPEKVRKVIYTTNAIESLHSSLRKVTRNRGAFLSEEAAFKLLYLALRNASKKRSTLQFWKEAMRQFEMIYPRPPPSGASSTNGPGYQLSPVGFGYAPPPTAAGIRHHSMGT
ncbi:MAG: transposase [Acidobacteriota bacterium]|nr:transposase [Acidobacteriota bacterium]